MKLAKLKGALVATVLACVLVPGIAWAEDVGWTVTFTGTAMESSGTSDITAQVKGMQPGSTATYSIELKNAIDGKADWYMRNEALRTMEETSLNNGGSYSYDLRYIAPDGTERVIYTNDTVSGDVNTGSTDGFKDATEGLEEWFYLDTLGPDAQAKVVLSVAIDGETHGNSYFDTDAALKLSFAAEPVDEPTGTPPTTTPTPNEPTTPETTPTPTPNQPTTPETTTTRLTQTGDHSFGLVALALLPLASGVLVLVANRRRVAKEAEVTR